MQSHPAGQRHHPAAVQVLHRILEPGGAPAVLEHAQQDVAPGAGKILAFVDDQHVVLPCLGQLFGGERGFHPAPDVGRGVVGRDAAGAQEGVAEHVEGGDPPAGRHQAFDVVGQRAVEADVQRAQAGVDGGVIFGQRQLGLAAAGGADHAQPVGREIEPARPGRQAAGEPRDHLGGVADHGAGVGPQAERVAEKARDFFELLAVIVVLAGVVDLTLQRQHLADDVGQPVLGGGVDDVARVDAGQVRIAHVVVGAVQQVVDGQRGQARRVAEALDQAVDGVQDLGADVFRPALVALDQAVRGFGQEAGFLLDQQHPPARRDNDEVDLAIRRETMFDVGPVDAVIDAVRRVFEGDLEVAEGFDFARGNASDGHFAPACRMDVGH